MSDVSATINRPLRAIPMSDFGEEKPDRAVHAWLKRHSEGRICPVCLEPISNQATTCGPCSHQWRQIKRAPHLLAEWIVDVAQHEREGIAHLHLWERS